MHKKLFLLFFSIMIFGTLAHAASAIDLSAVSKSVSSITFKPFGGRIIMTSIPNVTCAAGVGPITIQPVGGAKSDRYMAKHGANKTSGQPQNSQWILGVYGINSECIEIDGVIERPYPVTPITLYGVSGYK